MLKTADLNKFRKAFWENDDFDLANSFHIRVSFAFTQNKKYPYNIWVERYKDTYIYVLKIRINRWIQEEYIDTVLKHFVETLRSENYDKFMAKYV